MLLCLEGIILIEVNIWWRYWNKIWHKIRRLRDTNALALGAQLVPREVQVSRRGTWY